MRKRIFKAWLRCSKATKKPHSTWATGQVPWTHRRPSYPLSGCVPAEPDSVSPGGMIIPGTGGITLVRKTCNGVYRNQDHWLGLK
jgi:hypothetical protein